MKTTVARVTGAHGREHPHRRPGDLPSLARGRTGGQPSLTSRAFSLSADARFKDTEARTLRAVAIRPGGTSPSADRTADSMVGHGLESIRIPADVTRR